jgi:toxin ParE1/3/4
MSAFKLTPDAKASLSSIAIYTEKTWGKQKRNAYIKQLDDSFHTLARNPKLGKERPEIHPKLLSYGVAKHVVFYIKKPQFIVIVNILHKRMDYIQHISTTNM